MAAVNASDHVGLVYLVAEHWARRCRLPLEELVQEGAIGLMRAVNNFDPAFGVKFSTYAWRAISAAIDEFVIEKGGRLVHLPVRVARRLGKTGELPSAPMSLDAPADDGDTFHDLVADEQSTNPEREANRAEVARALDKALDRLDPITADMVRLTFFEDVPAKDIGAMYGMKRQGVEQRIAKAFARLRPYLMARGISATEFA